MKIVLGLLFLAKIAIVTGLISRSLWAALLIPVGVVAIIMMVLLTH